MPVGSPVASWGMLAILGHPGPALSIVGHTGASWASWGILGLSWASWGMPRHHGLPGAPGCPRGAQVKMQALKALEGSRSPRMHQKALGGIDLHRFALIIID